MLWERSENQFGRPKKIGRQLLEIFLKIHLPRENLRSAPGTVSDVQEDADTNLFAFQCTVWYHKK